MKRIMTMALAAALLAGCSNATDGDASTDTTNFNRTATPSSTDIRGDTLTDISDTGDMSHPGVNTGNDQAAGAARSDSAQRKAGIPDEQ